MPIAENGRTEYQIVTPGRSFPVENEAALYLQNAIIRITGARLPIRWGDRRITRMPTVWVGERDADSPGLWETDTCEIRRQGKDLSLSGAFRRGVHYAVTAFLEQAGVRFFAPDKVLYPEKKMIELPETDVFSEASFSYRHVFYPDTQIPEWALRMKLNVHDGSDRRWGPNARAHSLGHTFEALVPPARYYDRHPEYFCLVDGYRRREESQLCCTNPDVADVVCRNIEDIMKQHPDMNIFAVGQNDRSNWCECADCTAADEREGTHMGQVLTLVNRVAERFPDRIIATLAYAWSVEPPKEMRAADNALIVLCHNEGCFSHGLDKCEVNKPFFNRLKTWKEKADSILIWDYYVNYRHYLLPTANFRRLQNDLRLYRDLGIRNIFCQNSACTGGQFEHLRQYIESKLLWNPDLDVSSLMSEWANGVYGKRAAEPILEYINMLEDRQEKEGIHRPSFSMSRTYELFTPEVLKKGEQLWNLAEELAETEEQKQNVFSSRSAEMASRLAHTEGEYRLEGNHLKLFPSVDAALVGRFTRACIDANVSYLREDTGSPEDFQRDFGRTYKATVLENQNLKAIILPEVGGRIYSLVMKEGGKELLAVPDIFRSINCAPYSDGYDFSLIPERLGPGAVEEYQTVSTCAEQTVLETELENNCRISTEYALNKSTLTARHSVVNISREQILIEPVCNPAWSREIFGDESVISGVEQITLNEEERETRNFFLKNEECPDGVWTLDSEKAGVSIRAEFPAGEVSHTRVIMNGWLLQLQHCFRKRNLKPGETAEYMSSWSISSI